MKRSIDHILEGDIYPAAGVLGFSCTEIRHSVYPDQRCEGVFSIFGPPGRYTEGYVCTDELGMELYSHEFTGAESEIAYAFCANGYSSGDIIKGEFIIISNHGEYLIPYQITVENVELDSSIGPIHNLFHFTNLAKTNWQEALKLFLEPAFCELLKGNDRQYATVCRGLSLGDGGPEALPGRGLYPEGRDHDMEEFLQAIRKKQKIEYLVNTGGHGGTDKGVAPVSIILSAPAAPMEYILTINRNGWGHTVLACRAEGDFLSLGKTLLRDEDFLANSCKLPYYVDEAKLHPGKNIGCIHLSDAYSEMDIPVTVINAAAKKGQKKAREIKHCTWQLMNSYIAFRTKQNSKAQWRKESEALIDRLIVADDTALLPKLFRVQLLITENRLSEAGKMLNHADNMLQGREREWPGLWCYYIYLTTLENRDTSLTAQVTGEVERYFFRNQKDRWIGWLLCHLKEEYVGNPMRKWQFLKDLGSTKYLSPIIMAEAWQLLGQNPSLLTRLDDFEIRLLLFATKRGLLLKAMVPQIVYLVGRNKAYSAHLLKILTVCHDLSPTIEVLQGICELLIKGEKAGNNYHIWYRRGVEREIKVTRLYEYYLMSHGQGPDEQILKQAIMYFALNHEMDYRQQAYLFAYVHMNQAEFPEVYRSYHPMMERFVARQLAASRTGFWLAYLYKHFVTADMITDENATGLVDVLFAARITALRPGICEVRVFYDKAKTGISYRMKDGAADISLYGENHRIILVDDDNRRYADEGAYRLEKWLISDKIARQLAPLVSERIGYDLWLSEHGEEMAEVSRHNLPSCERLYKSNCLKSPYQADLCMKLLAYYYDQGEGEALGAMLADISPAQIPRQHHEAVLKMMITAQAHDTAYRFLCVVAPGIIDSRLILRIVSAHIRSGPAKDEQRLKSLSYRAFKSAKYDEAVLAYLFAYHHGRTEGLYKIWEAGKNYGLDVYALSERILTQIVYSSASLGTQVDVFKDYVAGGGKSKIVRAFLQKCSHDYFINNKMTDIFIVRQIERMLFADTPPEPVCELCYMKYFAENKDEINEENSGNLTWLLQNFLDQGIYFEFFKAYIGILAPAGQLIDKTIIEHRAGHGAAVTMHYCVEDEPISATDQPGDFSATSHQPMTEMYPGIYVKQFVLFSGEQLNYYITEESAGGDEIIGAKTSLTPGAISDEGRYGRLCAIETARRAMDLGSAVAGLAKYQELSYLVGKVF